VTHQHESFCRKLDKRRLVKSRIPSVVIADVKEQRTTRTGLCGASQDGFDRFPSWRAGACATGTHKCISRSGQLFPPWLATYIASSKRLQTSGLSNVPNQRGDLDFPGGSSALEASGSGLL
jgi:hypothetical protein